MSVVGRSMSNVRFLMSNVLCPMSDVRNPLLSEDPLSDLSCSMSDVRSPLSEGPMSEIRCLISSD